MPLGAGALGADHPGGLNASPRSSAGGDHGCRRGEPGGPACVIAPTLSVPGRASIRRTWQAARELDVFDGVLRSTRGGNVKNVLLYGLRGVGKTVLLGRFASMCRGEKFLPMAVHAYGPGDSEPGGFVSGLKRTFRSAIESSPRAEAAKGKMRSAVQCPGPPAAGSSGLVYEPPYGSDMKEPMADCLADFFVRNWKIIGDLGYRGAACAAEAPAARPGDIRRALYPARATRRLPVSWRPILRSGRRSFRDA